ncbi:unnamed protein product [Prorocentrum cordatum]|uniref:Uncharacterized protein n=1 Tax=Prorocentrum cordatum TaxID=2364126 RepID=A0ABN9R4I1_9DINO|nr:unnamed protein product [Polarella glacialis]|mmetsp:Transcript_3783/g.10067  ORF Transcript_3783/g.10067 Transcript_3783/m.10067 type:complete len:130 (-) Transcript_3783:46-435(-)
MSRALGVAALIILAQAAAAEAGRLKGSKANATARFTVNDKVYVAGSLFAEGSSITIGCNEHSGTSKFKVCGCNAKVIAHALSECQSYQQYDTQIGQCDCSTTACDDQTLTSGYSEKFEWTAYSFEIQAC